jgi:DNA-binding MarR family transcriptional regulator/GNAT superfamily N-acetyltransferase
MARGDGDAVARFRAFNRFYTPLVGTLARGYLGTPFSLAEARVVFEVGTHAGCRGSELRARAGFDQGHLSRVLARLEGAGLLRRTAAPGDRRAQRLHLTAKGRRAFRTLDGRADDQARAALGRLGPAQRAELAGAMATIERLLGDAPARQEPPPAPTLRGGRVGDAGWVLQRHALAYAEEFGYLPAFERYVSEGLPPFLRAFDPARDRLWVAELDGRPVGSVAIQHMEDRPGWAKLRWFLVEKEARGHGLGGRLLAEAIAFARAAGYVGILLWTVSDLAAARRLYERAGFALAEETDGCAWAPWAREQRWEMALR